MPRHSIVLHRILLKSTAVLPFNGSSKHSDALYLISPDLMIEFTSTSKSNFKIALARLSLQILLKTSLISSPLIASSRIASARIASAWIASARIASARIASAWIAPSRNASARTALSPISSPLTAPPLTAPPLVGPPLVSPPTHLPSTHLSSTRLLKLFSHDPISYATSEFSLLISRLSLSEQLSNRLSIPIASTCLMYNLKIFLLNSSSITPQLLLKFSSITPQFLLAFSSNSPRIVAPSQGWWLGAPTIKDQYSHGRGLHQSGETRRDNSSSS